MRLTLVLLATLLAAPALPVTAQSSTDSVEAQLCRNQLDLLLSRQKLTNAEQAVFQAQCDCLVEQAKSGEQTREDCVQSHE